MKVINYSNRTKDQIANSFSNLQSRYGKKVHYGNITPKKGRSLFNDGWFIVYL